MFDTMEEFVELRNIINRSENRKNQHQFGLNLPPNKMVEEINRDFASLKWIARKHCPHRHSSVDRLHRATIQALYGKMSEKEYERIFHQCAREMQTHHERKSSKRNRNDPFVNVQRMFRGY